MKLFKVIALATVVALLVSSCGGIRCKDDKYEGDMRGIYEFPDTFLATAGNGVNPYYFYDNFELQVCFYDKTAVHNYFDGNCDTSLLEDEIWNNYSVIVMGAEVGGCESQFNSDVRVNHSNKTVDFEIKAKGCGLCKAQFIATKIFLIDKIDSTYTLNFKVK